MANIHAFHGLRYDLGKVGTLSDVVAPPYDVIDSEYQKKLYDRHPDNVVRLILNRAEETDNEDSKYVRAAKFLKDWRRSAILIEDSVAAIYVYHQTFEYDGQSITRRGFMCRCGLVPFGEGNVYPHEETHSGPKKDRMKLITATKANLSQIFSIYPDSENQAQQLLENGIKDRTPFTAIDDLGVKHEMWTVTEPQLIARVASAMGEKPLFVADGHHRYETACEYRQHLVESEQIDSGHAANFILMMCVSMSDPGMIVLPTHRLFRGVPSIDSATLTGKLSPAFDVEISGKGTEQAESNWESIEFENDQSRIAFYCAEDETWIKARLNSDGESMLAELRPDRSTAWRSLGVSILHELVMSHLLGLTDLPSPRYDHSVAEVIDGLKTGDAAGRDATGQTGSGGRFELAALVMPATLEHIELVSRENERMPAKSTYFYPKLLSGLVINPLD